jgi:hypothetical protein
VNNHITVPPVTIGTHRLWTSLWTGLGRTEDNSRKTGGIRWKTGRQRPAVHSASPAAPYCHTASVDAHMASDLGIQELSPVSTDPMTTTYRYLTECQLPSSAAAAPLAIKRRAPATSQPPLGIPGRLAT